MNHRLAIFISLCLALAGCDDGFPYQSALGYDDGQECRCDQHGSSDEHGEHGAHTHSRTVGNTSSASSIAELRSLSPSQNDTVSVLGYYAPGDGGGGQFWYDQGSTSADNGGTIIAPTSAPGRWLRLHDGGLNVRWFGAKLDGVTDDTASVVSAIAAAHGSSALHFPVGQCVVSSTITIALPVTITGAGMGAASGTQTNGNCSQIIAKASFTSGDMFNVTTTHTVNFRDLQFAYQTSGPNRASGAAIHFNGAPPNVTASSAVDRCAFRNQYVGIQESRCVLVTVSGCSFLAWSRAAIETIANSAMETGGGFIAGNTFQGDTTPGTAQTACLYIHNGYANIHDNLILGSQYGVIVSVDSYNAGGIKICGNWIEEQTSGGVHFINSGGFTAAMVQITGNEFSVISNGATFGGHIQINGSSPWITKLIISDNVTQSALSGTVAHINVQCGGSVQCHNNALDNLGCAGGYGIICGANVSPSSYIVDNSIVGFSSGKSTFIDPLCSAVIR